jgi:3-oxoacyl-[acyl-carrier-protein] synthase-3
MLDMAFMTFHNVGVSGISVCVPRQTIDNATVQDLMPEKTLQKTIKTTGIKQRRIAPDNLCSSDFCFEAAQKLFDELAFDKTTIDVLIFVSQTPDYKLPSTATILQNRLKLSCEVAAFDINMGCSGYVYGLSAAFSYASVANIRNVLLLVGDTPTKFVNPKDRSTTLLFGDGGSASIITKHDKFSSSYFSLNSDGSGKDALYIKAGGYRYQSSNETLVAKEHEDGSYRNDEQLYMNGAEVFNFTINRVPADIKALLNYAGKQLADIDHIVYHQANKFITDFLTSKLEYPAERIPYSLERFGNTSCLSIPITIVTELKESLASGRNRLLLSGFGVGLSWATSYIELSNTHLCDLVEV